MQPLPTLGDSHVQAWESIQNEARAMVLHEPFLSKLLTRIILEP
jgi:hypothetical protein